VITCGAFAFAAAFGIGANDVANAFATSVGAKSLTLRQAIICAAIFEFAGAVTLGGNVADTIRGELIDVEIFRGNPEYLMLGMTCVVLATAIWLITATMLGLPVSTTHSVHPTPPHPSDFDRLETGLCD
jgi:phosphate/sulfate permease